MATLLVPPGPTRTKVLDILEAAVMSEVGRDAARRGGESALHVYAPDDAVTGGRLLAPLRFLAGPGIVQRRRGRPVAQAHFELSEHTWGWEIRATGRHVAMQYSLLTALAGGLQRQGFMSEQELDQAVAAMRNDEE